VVAYVRSFSGLVAEKPPQDNSIMQGNSFSYRVLCVNAPLAVDTNMMVNAGFTWQLGGNLRELRLFFQWPILPNGNIGDGKQTFRATVAGQLAVTDYSYYFPNIDPLYFYESQSFLNVTNVP
jgi:hypothetical protein